MYDGILYRSSNHPHVRSDLSGRGGFCGVHFTKPPSLKTFCSIKISSVCHLEPVGSRYLWIGKIGLHITDD